MSGRRPKRADLATREVLSAVRLHRFRAFEALCCKYPMKVVRAAIDRDVRADYLDYGVSADRPWLSPKGEQLLHIVR